MLWFWCILENRARTSPRALLAAHQPSSLSPFHPPSPPFHPSSLPPFLPLFSFSLLHLSHNFLRHSSFLFLSSSSHYGESDHHIPLLKLPLIISLSLLTNSSSLPHEFPEFSESANYFAFSTKNRPRMQKLSSLHCE